MADELHRGGCQNHFQTPPLLGESVFGTLGRPGKGAPDGGSEATMVEPRRIELPTS